MEPAARRTFHDDGTIACAVRIVSILPTPKGQVVVLPDGMQVRPICLALVLRHGSDQWVDGSHPPEPYSHHFVAGIGDDGLPIENERLQWL